MADDHASFREVLRELVRVAPGFSLVGEASCAEDLLLLVEELSPQLVVMDVCMPGMGGVEAARRLSRLHPEIMVVLISVYGPDLLPPALLAEADAAVFVPKEELHPRLLSELWREHRAA